jgi:predicted acyltransferase
VSAPAASSAAPAGAEAAATSTGRPRVVALDAVRGFAIVILLIAMHPGPRDALPYQLTHPHWHGLTFADLFFPVFLFAVGASIPFSARSSRWPAVLRRVALLTLIGIVLVSVNARDLRFHGVLQHIALSYLLAWLVLHLPRRAQVAVAGATVALFWLAFVVFAEGDDPYAMDGGFAHMVNSWFFGNFRTEGVPQSVISFVNVIVGAWCGRLVLEQRDPRRMVRTAALWAAGILAVGLVVAGWVPVNKKLWTPSYTLVTAGSSIAFFAAFAWLIEVRRWRAWSQPLVELGSNAIGVYVVTVLAVGNLWMVRGPLDRVLDGLAPPTTVTLGWSVAWLLLGWAVCRWLYRRRLFLKV